LQAFQALGSEALAPAADGVAIATQFGGDVLVGWAARLSGAQDDTAAEDQGLGGGPGTDQGFELGPKFFLQLNDGAEGARHSRPPGKFDQMVPLLVIMANHAPHA
jgi:hypothetical protein